MGEARSTEAKESAQLTPGTVVAEKYTLVRLLGAGGMGVVYEARDPNGERLALKVLHRHLASNAQVMKRFHREAELLKRLDGEHLVPLVDFGEHDGLLFMALACVDGLPLDRHVGVHGLLPIGEAVLVVADICAALGEAHAHGIIHRDLKPANVILEPTIDGKRRTRVLDFGLAKALHDTPVGSTALTEQHMIFGTPEYMSPEQVKGDALDERCDIYSAGVILYELLTGKPPLMAKTSVATMTLHLTETIRPPSEKAPERGISKALDAITLHALARDRDRRYRTARDLREALLRALEAPDDVASTRPPPPEDLASRDTDLCVVPPEARLSVDPLGSTAAFLAMKAPPSSMSPSLRIAMSDPPVTPELLSPRATERGRPWAWIAVLAIAAIVGIGLGVLVAFR